MWDDEPTARGEDGPVKADDDEADALRQVYTIRVDWRHLIPLMPADANAPGGDDRD